MRSSRNLLLHCIWLSRGAEKKEKHAPSFSSPLLGQIMIKIQCGSSACFFSVQRIREENRERQILVPSKLCTLTGLVLLGVRGWAACMAGPGILVLAMATVRREMPKPDHACNRWAVGPRSANYRIGVAPDRVHLDQIPSDLGLVCFLLFHSILKKNLACIIY